MNFGGKRVVIMGLGSYKDGSGISAALYFLRKGAKLLITDLKTKKGLAPQIRRLKKYRDIEYILGQHRKEDFRNADFIFKNPSVPKDSPYLEIARRKKIPIINDWTIFFQERPHNLIIGITGTKGKSTIATLIYQLLKNAGKNVVICGNIGQSPLAILNKIKKPYCIQNSRSRKMLTMRNEANNAIKTSGAIVVAELSSWLLHDFKQSPQIAIVTNLMPDHLDKYKNLKEYYRDKENIFRFQKKNDYLVLNKNDNNLKELVRRSLGEGGAKSKIIWFNQKNSVAAKIGEIFNIPSRIIKKTIESFKGLPNRLELIAEKNGIKYINDTTATTPDATIYALNSLKKYKGKIILIAGGMDKKLDYKNLAREISKYVKALILFEGTASEKIMKELKRNKEKLNILADIGTMKKAVKIASGLTSKGNIVLLSPAAASFNLFKNEFDRGRQFVKFVRQTK